MPTRALIDIFFSWNSLTNMAFELDQRLWIRCGCHFSPLRFFDYEFYTVVFSHFFLNLNKNKTEKLIFNARNGTFFFQYGISFSIECSKTTVFLRNQIKLQMSVIYRCICKNKQMRCTLTARRQCIHEAMVFCCLFLSYKRSQTKQSYDSH